MKCTYFFYNFRLQKNQMKSKSFTYAVVGLLLFGMGLSFLGEAIICKFTEDKYWVAYGTLALVVTNSGLCIFGQAVVEKSKKNG